MRCPENVSARVSVALNARIEGGERAARYAKKASSS